MALTAIGLCLLGGDFAAGYSYYLLGVARVVWANSQSVRYLSPSTFPEGSDADLQIRSAMGAWNLVPAADFLYSYVRLDDEVVIDHFDGYNDTAAVPAWQLDPGVLGVTYLVNNGPEWFDADILFSDLPSGVGYTFDLFPSCDVLTQPMQHGFSFLLIALHELGHGIGLGHDPLGNEPPSRPWLAATMNPRYPSGGAIGQENIVELHTDDRSGARFLYPHSGISGPPVRDLANGGYTSGSVVGKAVPVFFEPPSAPPGEPVSLRAVIENFGSTNEFSVRHGFYLSHDAVIDTGDEYLGALFWDLAFQDSFQFAVEVTLPQDWPAGSYYLGSILDDLGEVAEVYEDNNAAVYCEPLVVERLAPVINPLGQDRATCGRAYTGPRPGVTHPLNMNPLTWSLDNPEPGMRIDAATGVVSWSRPVPSPFLYTVILRATNSAASATQVLFLGVDALAPQILAIRDDTIGCGTQYTGPQPRLTSPECMNPILVWSLVTAPPGTSADPATGVVLWPEPIPALEPYLIVLRAANRAGAGTVSWNVTAFPGDLSGDGLVTPEDVFALTGCLRGPDRTLAAECTCADADSDHDVDLADAAVFLRAFAP